jgi:hypothetical protein
MFRATSAVCLRILHVAGGWHARCFQSASENGSAGAFPHHASATSSAYVASTLTASP